MSHKPEQLASSIQRAIQELIARGFADPRIRGIITVTDVKIQPDLQHATVHVSIMPDEHEKLTMHGLQNAAPFIRREIGKVVQTRRLPQIGFQLDRSFKVQAEVLGAIERIREERERKEATGQTGPAWESPTEPIAGSDGEANNPPAPPKPS
jgi:ribosome-binding factor A